MRVDDLDYHLPPERIAQHPPPERSASRLLLVDRRTGTWQDRRFDELPQILRPTDVLVRNNTRVVPARFFLRRATGGRLEGLWLQNRADGLWEVLLRGGGRLRAGERLHLESSGSHRYQAVVVERGRRGAFLIRVTPAEDAVAVLQRVGSAPLPPYIRRSSADTAPQDIARYQTVYARHPGAVAAPTAGLHFDHGLLAALSARGIITVELTLHVGLGTFQPIETERLEDHDMHSEQYRVSDESWRVLGAARQAGRRLVAVGTTSARVLETVASGGPLQGWTRAFIYPPYTFRMVDALITNFHLPRSTLLAMIYAFGGTDLVRRAYDHAVRRNYRFYSYGDAMLIA